MTEHPRASLGRVLDDLGSMLQLLVGDSGHSGPIERVAIHDPLDETAADRHALLLGVGLRGPHEIAALLRDLGPDTCAGLVVRSPVESTDALTAAAYESRVPILGLAPGTSWMQLAAILRSVLAHDEFAQADEEMLGGIPSGDLFALANAIAALLDAPVTIEDRHFRVLAFSGRQDEADPSRIGTILNREVSAARTNDMEERGVFRELYRSDDPLFVLPPTSGLEGFTMPRMALAVRAGDEILGSIWAAVHEPMSEERARTFREIGPLVALHLLRERAGADVERRLRTDLVAGALEGGARAVEAASKLGLSHQPVVVAALALQDEGSSPASSYADRMSRRRRTADAFAMHLSVAAPGSASALVGDVVYAIVPVHGAPAGADRRTARLATEFLTRTQAKAHVGVGTVSEGAAALPGSRDGADRALRVLRSAPGGKQVACISDVSFEALLIEFSDLMSARGDTLQGPVARLMEYDAKHSANLIETLRAYLDAFGNVIEAAQATYVHPNTFRYRLRRLAEVGEIDLLDADTRLSIMLQLRLLAAG
jgi:DNA-binding PucR family transcriptional regulator